MFKSSFYLIFFTFAIHSSQAQTCIHTDLSKKYDFQTGIVRMKNINDFNDSCIVTIIVKGKASAKIIQTITINSNYLFGDAFKECSFTRSYITKKNIDKSDIDNDFGDFIVADFNFDGREDFAVKNDSGGNGGPLYNFYINNTQGKFVLDNYLTETMTFFPTINQSKRTLTTLVHANAYGMSKTIYWTPSANKWIMLSKSFQKY